MGKSTEAVKKTIGIEVDYIIAKRKNECPVGVGTNMNTCQTTGLMYSINDLDRMESQVTAASLKLTNTKPGYCHTCGTKLSECPTGTSKGRVSF